jgi:exoribonuclease R
MHHRRWVRGILVAIADVDALVKRGSQLDDHARTNTTSVYTAAASKRSVSCW